MSKLKALGLLRVSTDAQDVARQRTDLKRLEAKHGLAISVSELHGVSGTETLNDVQVQQILKDLNGDVVGLAISSLDRLFRPGKRYGQFSILDHFMDAGKIIYSQREGIIDPATEEGYDKCISAGGRAGAEWRVLRQRSIDGKKECAAAGRLCHGSPPYGYLYVPKHQPNGNSYILDPNDSSVPGLSRQDVVRQIYQWRRAGMAIYRIAKELEQRGILSAGHVGKGKIWVPGGGWGRKILKEMLANRTYRGEAPHMGLFVPCPAIVDAEIWDAVQRVNAESRARNTGRPSKRQNLLIGFLWCGKCGHRARLAKSGKYPSYGCGNVEYKPYRERCKVPRIRTTTLERAAFSAVWSILTDPQMLYALAKAHYDSIQRPEGNTQCKQEIHHLQERIKRVRRTQWDGTASYEECATQIKADQQRIRELEEQLAAMGQIVNMPTEHAAEAACRQFEGAPEPATYESQRDILEGILDLRMTYLAGDLTIEGKVPVPAAVESTGTTTRKCNTRIDSGVTFVNSIPFILKRRVA